MSMFRHFGLAAGSCFGNAGRVGLAVLLCGMAARSTVMAQANPGAAALDGTVRDNTGAVVQDAHVVLRETARNLDRETVTNASGNFLFPNVSAGGYSVRVSKEGFEVYEVSKITLAVGQRSSFDVEMKLGAVTSVVSVSAEKLVLLETDSNTVGTVIDSARVASLPLNGRNFLQLALLAGGANSGVGNSDVAGQVGHPSRAVLIGGNMGGQTGYLINGIAARGARNGELSLSVSVAAVDQFKVQESFFLPDQGANPGLVNITTKGGTNQYHGEAFEFLRNRVFDARNFFAPTHEDLRRNQFGGAIGGPIRKDRIWFFANYEGLRQFTAFTAQAYAPTRQMFTGNLSELTTPIYDPLTFSAATGRQQFPGNVIPSNRINAVSANLLKYYLPGSSLSRRPNNVFGNPHTRLDDDQGGIRVDASLTQKQTIFLQTIAQNSPAVNPGLMPYTGTFTPLEAQLATIQHTYVLTPTLVNSFRIGFVRERVFQSNEGVQLGHILNDIGIHNTLDDRGLSGVSITGYASLGRASGDLGNQDNNYQLDESLTHIHGAHNFQYGLGIRYKRIQDQNANASALGNTFFQSTFTAQLAPNAQGALALQANTGNSFADFLLGYPTTGQLAGLPLLPYRFTQYTPYFQDTWKVARGLTFNYGISWYLATPPDPQGAARQLIHSFDFGSGLLKYAALGEIDPKVQRTDRKDFTPRFGVAWTPRFLPKTVIRAGAGVYYSDLRLVDGQYAVVAPPFNTPISFTNNPLAPLPTYSFGSNIFPAPPALPLDKNYAASLPNGTSTFVLDPNGKNPYVTQWNLSIQHALTPNDMIEIDYLGSSAHRLIDRYDMNACVPTGLFCDTTRRPYPRYTTNMILSTTDGNSSYEAGIVRYRRRTSAGLNLRAEYTFAKSLSDSHEGSGNPRQNAYCRACVKGPTTFNVAHRLVISGIYDLPFGKGRRFLSAAPGFVNMALGGWTISNVTTFQTGPAFDVIAPNTVNPGGTVRPNRLCDGRDDSLAGNLRHDGLRYFSTACFALPATNFLGTSGRDVLNGPGVNNWDVGIEKFFPVREKVRLMVRAEMFNTFNHAQFGLPNGNAASGALFGLVSSAAPPRLVQLAMKVLW